MHPRLGPVRLLRESIPVALVVLLWAALSWFAGTQLVATGVRAAGVVLGFAYAVVRGYGLATARPTATAGDARAILDQSLAVVLPAGAWFGLARLVVVLDRYLIATPRAVPFTAPVDALVFGATATGVLVVVLAAVASGVTGVSGRSRSRQSSSDRTGLPADD